MEHICFSPGPTQLHPIVPGAMQEAVSSGLLSATHRSGAFSEMYEGVKSGLRELLGLPDGMRVFFVGSATEAMERVVQNTVKERSHHFVNGSFSERLLKVSEELGRSASSVVLGNGEGFDLDDYEVPSNAELICVTQNETSTACMVPEQSLANLARRYPEKLIAVDVVSSCPDARVDYSLVDCAFFSVQKCFGLPAGLGVLMVSERAMARSFDLKAGGIVTGTYHSFETLGEWEAQGQTPETPNVLGIYLLHRVVEEYLKVGVDEIRRQTELKNAVLDRCISSSAKLSYYVQEEKFRSRTVTGVEFDGDGFWFRDELMKRGFEVGSGYKELKKTQSRIANFPMHTVEQFEALCAAMAEIAG